MGNFPFWWPEPIDNYYESIEVVPGRPAEYGPASPEMQRAFDLRPRTGEILNDEPLDGWAQLEREWFRLGQLAEELA